MYVSGIFPARESCLGREDCHAYSQFIFAEPDSGLIANLNVLEIGIIGTAVF
jgi:hypothetical protein